MSWRWWRALIEMVAEHAQGHRVCRVKLEIGKFTCVTPDAMRFCFDVVAMGRRSKAPVLEIVEIEALARCRGVWRDIRASRWLWTALPLRGARL